VLWTLAACGRAGTCGRVSADAAGMTTLPMYLCPDDCLECWLQARLDVEGCGGGLDLLQEWVAGRDADDEPVVRYVQRHGGYCDCEVLMNALTSRRLVLDDLVLSCGERDSARLEA
jgi:hypothetical protein